MRTLLLWGMPGDGPFDAIVAALRLLGAPVCIVDQRHLRAVTVVDAPGSAMPRALEAGGEEVSLTDVAAAYLRPCDAAAALRGPDADDPWLRTHIAEVEGFLADWTEVAAIPVLNRLSAMATNSSKPYQAELIRPFGFGIPDTIVTTDAREARAFIEQHRRVVYKSVSSERSIVRCLQSPTGRELATVESCPTQFQEHVPGEDWRVHIVADRAYACRITTTADDYRYAGRSGHDLRIEADQLPPDVERRCIALVRSLGLVLAGVDLRLTPQSRWFCFEVNPSPGFTYYSERTGQDIAQAIAEHLVRVARPAPPSRTAGRAPALRRTMAPREAP